MRYWSPRVADRAAPAPDADANWRSNNGVYRNGLDAGGQAINGTPKQANSAMFPTPTPRPYPGGVLLNEFLPHPGSGSKEFIEIVNAGDAPVDISGWQLDDAPGGSAPYFIPPGTIIQPGALMVFFKDATGVILNDVGDTARLLHPEGTVADERTYTRNPGTNVSWARVPDGGRWNSLGIPTPGVSNRADSVEPQVTETFPIGTYRLWPAGAWISLTGRVTVPPGLFSTRRIYIQDETGGVAVYLGRGNWPPLALGQSVTVFGYLRHQSGELQLYVRNLWHVTVGPPDDLAQVKPVAARTGQAGEAFESSLITVKGRVTAVEPQAFWLDDGSGAVRVFFSAVTDLQRPMVQRGEIWQVTGVALEQTLARDEKPRFRLQVRFAADAVQLTTVRGAPFVAETPAPTEIPPTAEPTETLEPTEIPEPTETPEPSR